MNEDEYRLYDEITTVLWIYNNNLKNAAANLGYSKKELKNIIDNLNDKYELGIQYDE